MSRHSGVSAGAPAAPSAPRGLVSLIMPAWRPNPVWLREAVGSALAQEGCNFELVVVDDGSPEPVVATLLADITDPRLRVLRVEHGGVSRARNAGIAAARGEWLRFIDADDVITPRSTAALLVALADGAGMAYGATTTCDATLTPIRTIECSLEGDVEVPCLLGRFDVMLPSILFDRRVVQVAGPWNESLALWEDYDFVLRATAHARVRRVDHVALLYRRHDASATRAADLAAGERAWAAVIDGFFRPSAGASWVAPPASLGGIAAPRPGARVRPSRRHPVGDAPTRPGGATRAPRHPASRRRHAPPSLGVVRGDSVAFDGPRSIDADEPATGRESCSARVISSAENTVSSADRRPEGPNQEDARRNAERHPSFDPSGDEPAGSNSGLPAHDVAGGELGEAEADQARGRRESAASRDNTSLGPHDQEFGDTTRGTQRADAPIRTDPPSSE